MFWVSLVRPWGEVGREGRSLDGPYQGGRGSIGVSSEERKVRNKSTVENLAPGRTGENF